MSSIKSYGYHIMRNSSWNHGQFQFLISWKKCISLMLSCGIPYVISLVVDDHANNKHYWKIINFTLVSVEFPKNFGNHCANARFIDVYLKRRVRWSLAAERMGDDLIEWVGGFDEWCSTLLFYCGHAEDNR